LDDVFEAAVVDDAVEAALVALGDLDFERLLLDFDAPPAAFFFGDAAFFFGLLALPADFGLAAVAFFAPVDALLLLALAAGAAAVAEAVVELLVPVVAVVVAAFFGAAFFGEAERFRLVPADFGLLAERAVLVLAAPGVFDRLRDLDADGFLAAVEPLVCFDDRFFAPARDVDFTFLFAADELAFELADEVVCDVLGDVVPLRSDILVYLRSECVYEYEAKKKKVVCAF